VDAAVPNGRWRYMLEVGRPVPLSARSREPAHPARMGSVITAAIHQPTTIGHDKEQVR
jgi:hypothetical protein